MPPQLLAHHTYCDKGYDNNIQNGPHNCRGPVKAQGSKAKLASRVSAAQSNQSEGQSDTSDGQEMALPGTPLRGPDILKLCI
jgi:hypothetical protein